MKRGEHLQSVGLALAREHRVRMNASNKVAITESDLELDVDFIVLECISNRLAEGALRREKIGISRDGVLLLNNNLTSYARRHLRTVWHWSPPSSDDDNDDISVADSEEAEFEESEDVEEMKENDARHAPHLSSPSVRNSVLSFAYRKWHKKKVQVLSGTSKSGAFDAFIVAISGDGNGTADVRWCSRQGTSEEVPMTDIILEGGSRREGTYSLKEEILKLDEMTDEQLHAIEAAQREAEEKRDEEDEAAAAARKEKEIKAVQVGTEEEEEEDDEELLLDLAAAAADNDGDDEDNNTAGIAAADDDDYYYDSDNAAVIAAAAAAAAADNDDDDDDYYDSDNAAGIAAAEDDADDDDASTGKIYCSLLSFISLCCSHSALARSSSHSFHFSSLIIIRYCSFTQPSFASKASTFTFYFFFFFSKRIFVFKFFERPQSSFFSSPWRVLFIFFIVRFFIIKLFA
jgi:hypothetical protein